MVDSAEREGGGGEGARGESCKAQLNPAGDKGSLGEGRCIFGYASSDGAGQNRAILYYSISCDGLATVGGNLSLGPPTACLDSPDWHRLVIMG